MYKIRRSQSTVVICQVNNNNYHSIIGQVWAYIGDFSGVTKKKGETLSFN